MFIELVERPPAPPSRRRPARTADDDRLTDLALAARAGGAGDVDAFVRAFYPEVWRFLAFLTDVEAADDLAQDTLMRALGGLPRFAARSSARAWLLAIARRVVVDDHRYRAARPTTYVADWHGVVEHRVSGPDERIALTELLAGLPDDWRRAFVLTQVAGLGYAEAADLLGCPIGTVRSRVARARERLRSLIVTAEQRAVDTKIS
ncbi:sigma-70 family RNA polymerase sigma factor [Thermomonospora umbrina]|uniref:RNA polymerase sigma factor n=1 Tax=Thermomonospora umbrina TaxID=111806 RepID=A0A3D9SPU1_9ACTN|nr:sigma-70 family RNA polymerase sigma factor [Thermomonospora umbrina]REE96480.1 RNA polymerase sigma-70 factor (ECF subfamily) [Thermomonospora umbrina]